MNTDKIIKIDTGTNFVKTFEIYKLVSEKNDILKEPTKAFDFSNPPVNPVYLAISMFETMFKHKGLGLSANQVGIPYSVFVVGLDEKNKQVFFNPKILETSPEEIVGLEGCLSFPKLFLKIKRPKWIKISYQHVDGEQKETVFEGFTARIISHEYDHLLGKVYIDKIGKIAYDIASRKRKKLTKRLMGLVNKK